MQVIDTVTRLDTIDALNTIFTRASTGIDRGAWVQTQSDHSGSTPTGNTGPGSNSVGSFVYSETTGGAPLNEIATNSTLTVLSTVMMAWTGPGRMLHFRAAIAGYAWTENGEGFIIQGRAASTDIWSTIKLIRGWPYSDTYVKGVTFDRGTDNLEDDLTWQADGGWADFEVPIPDNYTEVQMYSLPKRGTGSAHQHDVALWQIELRTGGTPEPTVAITTPAQKVDAGATVSLKAATSGDITGYAWTVDPAGSGRFANYIEKDTIWTAPSPAVETEYILTLAVTDNASRTARDSVAITVRPPVAQAEILSPLTASVEGAAHWPGGLVAEVESYRATMFGGPDAATLNVAGPEVGLRWLLTQLRRPLQLQGQQAGPVWWGYVHRVEARLGAVTVTASLDGLRTAIAVTCPDAESGATECREFQLAQPLAEQYGRIEMLNAVEDADAATEAELAELLAPHLSIARALEHSGQAATGARLYARGWSAALDWRFAPRHSGNARFGDATKHINELARPALGTSGDEVEWAAWCDFGTQGHPGYDLYLSSARLLMTGPAEGAVLTDPWMVGVRGRGSNGQPDNRLGAEIALDASDLPRVSASAPYAIVGGADARLLEFDFSGQEILLPQAGFFVTVGGALTPQFQYVRTDDADPLWSGDAATGVWSWGQVGSNGWAQASNDAMKRPVYDFSVRAKAPGLLRMLLEEHDILRAGPAPEEVGAQSYGLYLEGKETVAQRLAEVHKAERLGYVVDATRTVRFFESGESVWRLGRDGQWQTQVARGAMPFLGQHVRSVGGDMALCESASYTPRTGLWELGFRGLEK